MWSIAVIVTNTEVCFFHQLPGIQKEEALEGTGYKA